MLPVTFRQVGQAFPVIQFFRKMKNSPQQF
jgi:hypothetical protein